MNPSVTPNNPYYKSEATRKQLALMRTQTGGVWAACSIVGIVEGSATGDHTNKSAHLA
jgi:hypothetical protein